MHGIRRGSTRASPFSLRISARAPCAVAGVRRLKCAHRWPGDDVPIRALSGLYWKLMQVIGMDRSFYGRWSDLQRGLIAIRGIYRKLSEFNGIYWDFSRPQLITDQWLAANYRLFSLVLMLFPGSRGLFGPGWPVGVSWCWWPLWRRRERGVAVLLVRRRVCFCGVGGVVCAALCAQHLVTFAALLCRADAGFGAELGAALVAAVELCRCQWCLSYAVTGVFRLVVCGAGVRRSGAPMCASCRCQRSIRGVLAALRPLG